MYHYTWLQGDPESSGEHLWEMLVHAGLFQTQDQALAFMSAWVLCFFILGLSLVARMGLNRARAAGGTLQFVPDRTLSIRNIFELCTGGLYNLCKDLLGAKDAPKFFWLSGGLFIYILLGNFMGLIPGFMSPTGSMDHNFAMAFVVLIVFNFMGLKTHGAGYVKHMAGPWLGLLGILLNVLLLSIETVSYLVVRPYSLSLRLMGNMFGDHMVFGIMTDLTSNATGGIIEGGIPLLVPCAFLGLGMFVSIIQALVFTLLSTIYIALAVAHEDDH
jgi:F-type H+-transporting ATPase subunit a